MLNYFRPNRHEVNEQLAGNYHSNKVLLPRHQRVVGILLVAAGCAVASVGIGRTGIKPLGLVADSPSIHVTESPKTGRGLMMIAELIFVKNAADYIQAPLGMKLLHVSEFSVRNAYLLLWKERVSAFNVRIVPLGIMLGGDLAGFRETLVDRMFVRGFKVGHNIQRHSRAKIFDHEFMRDFIVLRTWINDKVDENCWRNDSYPGALVQPHGPVGYDQTVFGSLGRVDHLLPAKNRKDSIYGYDNYTDDFKGKLSMFSSGVGFLFGLIVAIYGWQRLKFNKSGRDAFIGASALLLGWAGGSVSGVMFMTAWFVH